MEIKVTSPLSKTKLIIPRVLCIGTKEWEPNDTSGNFKSGQIITVGSLVQLGLQLFTASELLLGKLCTDYPNCFKPLPWWEGRTVEEMPLYLKDENGEVWKVSEYSQSGSNHVELIKNFHDYERPIGDHDLYELQPADESEYQEYQKQREVLNG